MLSLSSEEEGIPTANNAVKEPLFGSPTEGADSEAPITTAMTTGALL